MRQFLRTPLSPRSADTRAAILIILCALFCAGGCVKRPATGPYVARVGSAELTREDLIAAGDSLTLTRGQSRAFVDEWVVSELLYQEAQRRGVVESDNFKRQVESARKQLAIDALLEKELYASDVVDDETVAAFFRSHASSFLVREDVIRASYALFADRDAANLFRSTLLRGTAWDDAVRQTRADSLARRYLLTVARNQYFTQATLFPEELWKLAHTLARDEVSFAVRTGAGFYVLIVHAVRRAGDPPDFEFVKHDVRDRLLIEHRRARYEKLVGDLRSHASVDIQPGITDTTGAPNE